MLNKGVELLARLPLFARLPMEELERLAAEMRAVDLLAGAILFRKGERGDRFYVVVEGQVEVVQSLDTPDERVAARRVVGDFVGEMSLLNPDGLRTASIRAAQPARLWEMTREQFEALVRRQPGLAYDVARVLSSRMTSAQQATIDDLRAKNRELAEAYRALQAAQAQIVEKERLEKELQVARDIQMSVLPSELPTLPGFGFTAHMEPARAVGGDFYDLMTLDAGRVGIAVGDVAGKGVPAALFMTQVQALLHARADARSSPTEVLTWVNRQILERGAGGLFVTVLYGILETEGGSFAYARAGHEVPVLAEPGGVVTALPFGPGQPLGLWDGSLMDEQEVRLRPGASLLLYTDGVSDGRNAQDERFGSQRLLETVARLAQGGASAICGGLWQAIADYRGETPAYDDTTLVAVTAE